MSITSNSQILGEAMRIIRNMVLQKIFYCYFTLRWSVIKLQTTVVTFENQISSKAANHLNVILG